MERQYTSYNRNASKDQCAFKWGRTLKWDEMKTISATTTNREFGKNNNTTGDEKFTAIQDTAQAITKLYI